MPFIVGTGRCGSTLLRLMLDSHPELAIPDETHFIPMLAQLARQGAPVAALANALRDDARWRALGMDPEALVQRALLHDAPPLEALLRAFYEAYAARSGKRRYGDKTPPYVHHMPLIRGVLSEARFVHLIRDGRDVAVSMREAWWGPDGLAETAAWWAQTILAARACAMGTEAYLEIRYEDLVTEPEQTLRRICRFLQLDWDPAMLAYSSTARARLAEMMGFTRPDGMHIPVERVRALHSRVAGPPDPSRIDAWRGNLSPEEAHQFDLLAGPLLAEFGYPSSA